MADNKAGALEPGRVLGGREGDVDRRGFRLPTNLPQRPDQRLAGAFGSIARHEEASPGRRGEGRGDLKLGVIAAARAFIGVGPGMIEHIFALAMALEIRGRGSDDPAGRILNDHMRRRPAGTAAGGTGGLERMKEGVRDERVEPLAFRLILAQARRIGAGVPRLRIDIGDGGDKAGGEGGCGGHAVRQGRDRSLARDSTRGPRRPQMAGARRSDRRRAIDPNPAAGKRTCRFQSRFASLRTTS